MKIIKAGNILAVDYIKDKFILEPSEDRDVEAESLKAGMRLTPDRVFVLIAFEGEEVMSFCVAIDVENSDYVYIHQAWCDPKAEEGLTDKMFYRLILWADSKNKSFIRAETKRADAIIRKWNFIEHSSIVKFEIPQNFETEMLKNSHKVIVGKDNENGGRLRPKDGISLEAGQVPVSD